VILLKIDRLIFFLGLADNYISFIKAYATKLANTLKDWHSRLTITS